MKFNGKLLTILLITELVACSLYGAQKPSNISPKNKTINEAVINQKDSEIASNPYEPLPKEDIINTLYPDPLSDDFMGTASDILNKERSRSTSDLVREFEGQAKVINDSTQVPDEIIDNHSKEDRERIEARADRLLREGIQKEKALLGKDEGNKEVSNVAEESPSSYEEKLTQMRDGLDSEDGMAEAASHESLTFKENDPEFEASSEGKLSQEDIMVEPIDDSQLPIEIPDYANLQGIVPLNNDQKQVDENGVVQENAKQKNVKLTAKQKQKRKMAEPLEPVLLIGAKPKNEEEERTLSFTGLLTPEKHPLGRKKYMNRWVLKLDDGSRIPLKSTLKLLQEVRKEGILDDYVTVEGKMLVSPMEENLKYLVPENFKKGVKKVDSGDLEFAASSSSDSQTSNGLASNTSNVSDSKASSNLIEPRNIVASDSLSLAIDG